MVRRSSMTWGVLALAIMVVALLVWVSPGGALTIDLTDEQRCSASSTIVVASVIDAEAAWTGAANAPGGGGGTIETMVQLRILEILKGHAAPRITISLPGGRVGATQVTFSDAPCLSPGNSYVLFLDAGQRVVGWREGTFLVNAGRVPRVGMSLEAFERRVTGIVGAAPVVLRHEGLAALRSGFSGETRRVRVTNHPLPEARAAAAKKPMPRITGISPATASAGTGTPVTIKGTGFGSKEGRVEFFYKYDSGKTLRIPVSHSEIVSWSPTQVVCWVPVGIVGTYLASAGSGPVRLRNQWKKWSNEWDRFSVSFANLQSKLTDSVCRYRINTGGANASARSMIVSAAETWNAAGAKFTFVDGGDCGTTSFSEDGHNDILFGTIPDAVISTIGRTRFYESGTSSHDEFDIMLNSAVPWGNGLSSVFDVQSVVVHELGHALGLRDLYGPRDAGKVMLGNLLMPGTQRRTLADGDRAGIVWLYGKRPVKPGNDIAYIANGDLFVVTPDGGTPRHLTSTPDDTADSCPAWSPDRTRIAFLRHTLGKPGELWMTTARGKEQHRVEYSGPSLVGAAVDLAWSADGRYLAGARYLTEGERVTALQITILDLSTLTSRVACELYEGEDLGWLYLASIDWSPDGTQLVTCDRSGETIGALMRIDVQSGNVLFGPVFIDALTVSWSPVGAALLVGKLSGGSVEMLGLDGTLLRTLYGPIPGTYRWRPVFSPDGAQYAFIEASSDLGTDYLKRVSIDGGEPVTLVKLNGNLGDVAWK